MLPGQIWYGQLLLGHLSSIMVLTSPPLKFRRLGGGQNSTCPVGGWLGGWTVKI